MGVVYKLKNNVVDFILLQKRDNPSLSCRALSLLVQQNFDQKVSKSSINKILKEAALSSPVGRRGDGPVKRGGKKKKFKLSERKKKAIFPEISKNIILSDLANSITKEGLIDGMGGIFLKAAEWEIAREPVLEGVMKEYCQQGDRDALKKVAGVLPFLKLFHIESLEGLVNYHEEGLWVLNEVRDFFSEQDVVYFLDQITDRQEFYLRFSMKIPQLFSQVLGFRFILKDGSSFFLDGQNVSVWKNSQGGFPVSLAKATEILAKILNNVQSVVVNAVSAKSSGKTQESSQIIDFFHAFENVQSKRIVKIELVGESAQVLGDFEGIPQVRRPFIVGLWPWENLFQTFLEAKNVLSSGKIDEEIVGRELTYKEVRINRSLGGKGVSLRGVLVYEAFMQVPFLILATNTKATEIAVRECVSSYVQRWPNIEKGINFSIVSDPSKWKGLDAGRQNSLFDMVLSDELSGRDPIWFAIDQLLLLLNRFSRRNYFPENYENVDFRTMQHRFYSLPGRIVSHGERVEIQMKAPTSSACQQAFYFAVQRFNESGIKNFLGQHVHIYIL